MIDSGKSLGHHVYAIAAEVFHQFRKFGIAAAGRQGPDRTLIAKIIHQPAPPYSPALIGQC